MIPEAASGQPGSPSRPKTDGASSRRRRWVLGLVAIGLVLFSAPLCWRSITLADEGYLLMQSLDLLEGKVPYRDMDAFITPGAWLLLAGTFAVLGPSVWASRVPVLIALLALYGVSYCITSRLCGPRAGLATVAAMVVCTVWAFPAWTFAFYSPFSVLFALLALERLLAWRERPRPRDLFLCGLLIGGSIVFKQNYGVFGAVGLALGLAAVHVERRDGSAGEPRSGSGSSFVRDAALAALGVVVAGLPFFLWLSLEGALPAAWHSLVVHPFEFSGLHGIPYLPLSWIAKKGLLQSGTEMLTYAAQPIYRVPPVTGWIREIGIVERMHVPFYWLPPVVLVAGAALSYRPDRPAAGGRVPPRDRPVDAGLASVVAVAGGVFLGVFPRADFNHLANVYQPIVIAGVVVGHRVLSRLPRPRPRLARAAILCAALVLSLYVAAAVWWYYGLLAYLNTRVGLPRAGVLAREEQERRITFQVETIRAQTEEGEAVLTLPDLAMLNFLADRPVPSPYYNMYEHHIAHDGGAAVVAGAERAGVRLAVTRYNDFFSDRVGLREYAPVLVDYLRSHFRMAYTVGHEDFIVFLRRETPIHPPESLDLLPFCDTSAGYQRIRRHLLFSTLYHDPGTGHEMTVAAMQTPCRFRVPDGGATLALRIDYRAPARVVLDTTLTAEVLLAGETQNELLLRRRFVVRGQGADVFRREPAPELRVDLDRWAGREIELLLRTTRRGIVLVRPLEQRGFGTSWQDPRLLIGDPAERAVR